MLEKLAALEKKNMWGLDHSKGKEEIIVWTSVAIVMLIGPDRRSTSVLCVFVGGYSVSWWCPDLPPEQNMEP